MSILDDSANWEDHLGATPPESWEALVADERFWFSSALAGMPSRTTYIGAATLPSSLTIPWEITEAPSAGSLFLYYDHGGVLQQSVDLGSAVGSGEVEVTGITAPFTFFVSDAGAEGMLSGGVVAIGTAPVSYNCECDEEDVELQTLAALRRRMLIRGGYAAQAANPPPGMVELLNDYLADAQRILYKRFPALRKSRFYAWTMEAGTRFYGIRDNEDACTKKLDPYLLEWVGVEDLNGQWYELKKGIPPEFYTDITNQSWPTRYEIRQCIEVFPVPAGAYKLRIKGAFGLMDFAADADKTTVPASPVFHWALGMWKADRGKADASTYFDIALKEIGDYVAGGHGTKRYIPRRQPLPPPPKPVFLPDLE